MHFDSVKSFQNYLFDPDTLKLFSDNRDRLIDKIKSLSAEQVVLESKTIDELKDDLVALETEQKNKFVSDNIIKLKENKLDDLNDIYLMFNKIINKEVPDAPLFLEWNCLACFAA